MLRIFEMYALRKQLTWTAGSARTVTPMILYSQKEELTGESQFTEEQFRDAYNKAYQWQNKFQLHAVFT